MSDASTVSRRIVVATKNAHKVAELQSILGALLPVELVAYDGDAPEETGSSFAENAMLKARIAAETTGLPALADDSGIAVDVMGGAPGLFSARWGGVGATDARNRELLLEQLASIPVAHRSAHFVCAAAFAAGPQPHEFGFETAPHATHLSFGRWHGSILLGARGAGGFGYDPVFQPDGLTVSAAELDPAEKNRLSHRVKAFSAMSLWLKERIRD